MKVKYQARSQDFFRGGGVAFWEVKMQTSRGVRGHAPPGKILESLECLGLHFYAF